MWSKVEVEMTFLTKLVGSVPADPNLQKKWLESRKPKNRPPSSKSIEEVATEVLESTPEESEPTLHIFQRFEGGLALRMATVRAHLKECARTLSSLYIGKVEGEKSFSVKVLNGIYYPPEVYWLPVLDGDGKLIAEPTGQYDKAIHFSNPRTGQKLSAIKTMEFVEGAVLKVPLLIMTQPSGKLLVNETDLKHLFEYGGVHGYGGERGDGEGRYVAKFTRIDDES